MQIPEGGEAIAAVTSATSRIHSAHNTPCAQVPILKIYAVLLRKVVYFSILKGSCGFFYTDNTTFTTTYWKIIYYIKVFQLRCFRYSFALFVVIPICFLSPDDFIYPKQVNLFFSAKRFVGRLF